MIWFPWKLGYITTIGGLANAGGLIVLYEGNVLPLWAFSTDQNLSTLDSSVVAMVIVVTCWEAVVLYCDTG